MMFAASHLERTQACSWSDRRSRNVSTTTGHGARPTQQQFARGLEDLATGRAWVGLPLERYARASTGLEVEPACTAGRSVGQGVGQSR